MTSFYQLAVYHRNIHGGNTAPRITSHRTPDDLTVAVLSARQEPHFFALRTFQVKEVAWPATFDCVTKQRFLFVTLRNFLRKILGVLGILKIGMLPFMSKNKSVSLPQTAKK
jgi:hypothetical protein